VSTFGDILKRHGLIRPRRRRVRVMPAKQPFADCVGPNDTWCIDFKGHFRLGDGTRCYPLTITDAHSRYCIKIEALDITDTAAVRRVLEQAFAEFGLPRRIRSDNGPPFASLAAGGLSALSIWWLQLGITHERIEPGKPQQNGRLERFHRTLKQEVCNQPKHTLAAQQRAFDVFRHEYNDQRPHEALGQTPPARHYEPSLRPYPIELTTPSYTDEHQTRWTGLKGDFSWRARKVFVHSALVKQPVGIRQISEHAYEVFYGRVLLGHLDDRDSKPGLRRPPSRPTSPTSPIAGKELPVLQPSNPDTTNEAPQPVT
jgi:transposase InsO family protein